jgi:hypothetical protein
MRHDDLALERRLQKIAPRGRRLRARLSGFRRVVADDAEERVHARPGVGRRRIAEGGLQRGGALGLIGLEQAGLLEQQQRGGGETHHHVGARIVLFGEETRRDDAGGIAHPRHVRLRHSFLDARLERAELIVLQRGVDRHLGLLRERLAREDRQTHSERKARCMAQCHVIPSDRSTRAAVRSVVRLFPRLA